LDFVRKGFEGAALIGGGGEPVFLKFDDWLKAEGGGSDLQLEDSDKVSGGRLCKVDNNWLQNNGSVGLLTNLFSERRIG
jgi:hypothetical protein